MPIGMKDELVENISVFLFSTFCERRLLTVLIDILSRSLSYECSQYSPLVSPLYSKRPSSSMSTSKSNLIPSVSTSNADGAPKKQHRYWRGPRTSLTTRSFAQWSLKFGNPGTSIQIQVNDEVKSKAERIKRRGTEWQEHCPWQLRNFRAKRWTQLSKHCLRGRPTFRRDDY
jgi:hypothetical protein